MTQQVSLLQSASQMGQTQRPRSCAAASLEPELGELLDLTLPEKHSKRHSLGEDGAVNATASRHRFAFLCNMLDLYCNIYNDSMPSMHKAASSK